MEHSWRDKWENRLNLVFFVFVSSFTVFRWFWPENVVLPNIVALNKDHTDVCNVKYHKYMLKVTNIWRPLHLPLSWILLTLFLQKACYCSSQHFFFFMAAQHVPCFTHTHTCNFLSHFLLAIIEDLHKLAEELYLITVIVKVIRPRCRRWHLLFIRC